MKEIERLLEEAPLVQPRDRLDTRMDQLFSEPPRPRRILTRPVALWQTATACAVCAAFGFLLHRAMPAQERPPSEVPSVVYIIEAGTRVPMHAFDLTQRGELFPSEPADVQVRVITPAEKQGGETNNTI